MRDGICVAIDGMGGDRGPRAIARGMVKAVRRVPGIRFRVWGQEELWTPLLRHAALRKSASLHHADSVISADCKPSQAVRNGKGSSMWLAIKDVRDGHAQCAVSSGNTGALTALGMLLIKRLGGISRAALATTIPTIKGECCVLDLGASVDCAPKTLIQNAVMGQLYARQVMGLVKPRLALLNIGEEEMKGSPEIRTADGLLKERLAVLGAQAPFEYVGFAEGDFMRTGHVDVLVSNGFTGNILLKAIEGTAKTAGQFLRQAFRSDPFAGLGYLLARRALLKHHYRTDPRRHNGAMLLGLNGLVVKSHGNSDSIAFAAAIERAVTLVSSDFASLMAQDMVLMNLGEGRPAMTEAS